MPASAYAFSLPLCQLVSLQGSSQFHPLITTLIPTRSLKKRNYVLVYKVELSDAI